MKKAISFAVLFAVFVVLLLCAMTAQAQRVKMVPAKKAAASANADKTAKPPNADKPVESPAKPAEPALKPEVSLEIRELQLEMANLAAALRGLEKEYEQLQEAMQARQLRMRDLESRYQNLQNIARVAGDRLSEALKTALDRSGLDQQRHELDPAGLKVRVKPEEKKD